jgi:hypothetical protein
MSRTAKIAFNWRDDNGAGAISGYTVKDRDANAVAITDTSGVTTGLTLNFSAVPGGLNNGGQGIAAIHGYPAEVIAELGVAAVNSEFDIIIDGTLNGEVITKVKVWAGVWFSTPRTGDFTLDGVTLQHNPSDGGLQPPIEFSTNTETLPLTLNCSRTAPSDGVYVGIVEIELTAVATADADTFYGDTLNYTSGVTGVTTATLMDSQGNTLALTNVTDTSATVPALVAGLDGLLIEDGVSLTLSNGTDNASTTLNFIVPTGYELTTLTSIPFEPLETDWLFGFDTNAVVGDQSLKLVSDASITHNADGTSTATAGDSYTYYTIEASTGVVSEVVKIIEAAPDVAAPVITVSGPTSQSIPFGSTVPTFISSTDDGSAVVVGGDTVNNSVAGTYVITFDATDLAGNVATQITRTVIVEAELDTTAPVITVSGNATMTIPFNGTSPTFTSSTDDGSTVVVGGDTVNTGVAGTYVITFNATDTSGNAATQVTRTVIVEAEVVNTTILNMTLTGTPDGSHDVRVVNPAQMSDSFILAATFSGGSASLITPFNTPTALEYYVIGTTEGGLQRGTTE